MKKVNVDGLLALNPKQIKIIYWRCRGENVDDVAGRLNIGESTIYNIMKEIHKLLGTNTWEEIEGDLSVPLLRMVKDPHSLDDWPEGYREKIESLRDPPGPQGKEPEKSPVTPPTSPSGSQKGNTEGQVKPPRPTPRIPWPLIAIPLLILCVLCVSVIPLGWQFIERFIGNTLSIAQATRQPTPIPPYTETHQPTDTTVQLPVATQPPVAQVLTDTPTATPTPPPTETLITTATTTPTITNTPGPTLTPTNMSLGDTGSDARVSLKLGNDLAYDIDYGGRPAVGFRMEFSNHSGETILLNYNPGDFTLFDNLGREYECYYILRYPYSWQREDHSPEVKTGSTHKFTLGCGPGMKIDGDVTSLVLSVAQFSSLTNLVWDIEIPR